MELQNFLFIIALSAATALLVNAQNGPYPPRLSIPGAVPVGTPARPQVVRVRRPVALRAQNTIPPVVSSRLQEDPKPVTESAEDEQPDVFLPQLLREQQLAQAQQVQFQHAAAAFLNNEPGPLQESHLLDTQPNNILPAPTRLPERLPSPIPNANRQAFNDFGIGRFESQRFGQERPSPSKPTLPAIPSSQPPPQRFIASRPRPAPVQPAPIHHESRNHYTDAQDAPAPAVRPRPKPIQARPIIDQNQLQDDREVQQQRRRPVAQTIRKWRDENDDGSITWGYENDDGSFKEEIIGTDCVTKGTYGYIDPDGNKREYHYETGIKCDPNTRQTDDEIEDNAFINYEDNKAVLPNGLEIDMAQLGKKKSKRPLAIYRN